MALRISDDLELPNEAQTQTFAILAKRGVGKTYTASVMAEEMAEQNLRFVVMDPVGVWWGLRSSASGKRQGYPIRVLGGDHGDLPLEATAGSIVADLVVERNASLVLDLSGFRKGEQHRFVTDFAETLYLKNRKPIHLFLDEADSFAPQVPAPDERRMLGAFEDLVRRGRARGIGVTLITQRAAVLNKNVLTQIEVLVVLRTTGPHDRKAIESWVEVHGEPDEQETLLSSLASLKVGEAWFWSPGWLKGLFKKVRVRVRRTFDSSATPDVNHEPLEAKMAEIDLRDLREAMAETVERVKESDPKALKAEVVRLRAELARKPEVPKQVETQVLSSQDKRRLTHLRDSMRTCEARVAEGIRLLTTCQRVLQDDTVRLSKIEQAVLHPPHVATFPAPVAPKATAPRPSGTTRRRATDGAYEAARGPADASVLLPGRRKILDALAFLASINVFEPSKKMLALFCRKSPKSGGYNNDLGKLRSGGFIDYPVEGHVSLTDAGRKEADASKAPQTLAALHAEVQSVVKGARWKIVSALIEVYPRALSKEELAEKIGKSAGSGGFNNDLGKLRSAGVIEYPESGTVRADDALFPEGLS